MSIRTAIALAATIVCLIVNTDPASAGNWSPNNAMVLGSSTAFSLIITPIGRNAEIFGCKSITFLASTSMAGSSEWTFTPNMFQCTNVTASWTTAGQWKAVSVRINAGAEAEANLEIPANGFEFEPTVAAGGEAGCKVKARATTIGEAKDFLNRNPFAPPSFWTSSVNPALQNKVKIEAKNGANNCLTNQTEVPIIYAFNLYNLTNGATEGIHVN